MGFSLSGFHLITHNSVREVYIPVPKFAHKGSNGLGILIAGSRNMPGAALLSAKAALRSGLGKIVLHAPAEVLNRIFPYVPEMILSYDSHADCFSALPNELENAHALAIGPGLGKNVASANGVYQLLQRISCPIILDADALNILAENKEWISMLPQNSILTPHAGEFERLTGKSAHFFERMLKSQDFSQKHAVIVVLKGHYTIITTPDGQVFMNTTGNQGMATAGSGDVLTGILLGLLTKGYSPENAAKMGVFIHGLAGDLALEKQSHESLIASDIIDNLGKAFETIRE